MRRPILAALLALLALPVSAHAGYFAAEVIDGPSADIVEVGDVDISRDGGGGLVYVKRDGGVPHVFFSAFVDGVFQAPVRIDNGMAGPSSSPVIGASDNGRLAIAFVNDGTLWTAVKARDAAGMSAPAAVAQGGVTFPSIDVSINGVTYVSWTQNADVYAARAERDSAVFRQLPGPLDVAAPQPAGDTARKASKIDVSADGAALLVWSERGTDGRDHVIARRLFELRPSTSPQDLTLDEVEGARAAGADSPELDMEDDSSYAQVVFRQNTVSGPRMVMRRLVGSTFDPHAIVDGGLPGERIRIDLTGRGEGLYATSAQGGEVIGGLLFNNRIAHQLRLDPGNGVAPNAVPAMGDNEDGMIAWMQGTSPADATVRARVFDGAQFLKMLPEATLSKPEFGPVFTDGGIDAEASRAGDVAAVFIQGTAADRRLVAGFYDQPPTRVAGSNGSHIRRTNRLSWGATRNLFGGTRYRVFIDGRQIAETAQNFLVPAPGSISDGEHRWQIQVLDRRGQAVMSRTRRLRVDNTPPTLSVGYKKSGRMLTVSVKAADRRGKLRSGMRRVTVDWGDKRLVPVGRRATKRFARTGTYTVRVKALDRAGNETVKQRRVRIG